VTNPSVKQGIKIFKAGDKEKARLVFKAALKQDPNDETAWFWLAATYKKRANQIKCLRKLLEINPHHQSAREQLEKLLGKKLPSAPAEPKSESAQEVKEVPPAQTSPPPSLIKSETKPSDSADKEEDASQPEEDISQWRSAAIAGLGIFGALAILVGALFGNALFSTTDFNSLLSEWMGNTPASIATVAPSPTFADALSASPTAEVLPLSLTPASPVHASPHPIITQVLNIPTTPPLMRNFPCLPQNTQRIEAVVLQVVDGDSIEIEYQGEQYSVRYIGINAPETYPREYFSEEANTRNVELVEGQTVTLVKDISNTDQDGNLLRYVIIDELFINQALVNEGYALAASFPPDIACDELFVDAQEAARLNNKGMWKNIPLDSKTATPVPPTPTSRVEQTCLYGCKEHYPGCDIKGNINLDLEKIYHLPGSQFYAGTIINTKQGERWFCTVEEAESNGWRAAE